MDPIDHDCEEICSGPLNDYFKSINNEFLQDNVSNENNYEALLEKNETESHSDNQKNVKLHQFFDYLHLQLDSWIDRRLIGFLDKTLRSDVVLQEDSYLIQTRLEQVTFEKKTRGLQVGDNSRFETCQMTSPSHSHSQSQSSNLCLSCVTHAVCLALLLVLTCLLSLLSMTSFFVSACLIGGLTLLLFIFFVFFINVSDGDFSLSSASTFLRPILIAIAQFQTHMLSRIASSFSSSSSLPRLCSRLCPPLVLHHTRLHWLITMSRRLVLSSLIQFDLRIARVLRVEREIASLTRHFDTFLSSSVGEVANTDKNVIQESQKTVQQREEPFLFSSSSLSTNSLSHSTLSASSLLFELRQTLVYHLIQLCKRIHTANSSISARNPENLKHFDCQVLLDEEKKQFVERLEEIEHTTNFKTLQFLRMILQMQISQLFVHLCFHLVRISRVKSSNSDYSFSDLLFNLNAQIDQSNTFLQHFLLTRSSTLRFYAQLNSASPPPNYAHSSPPAESCSKTSPSQFDNASSLAALFRKIDQTLILFIDKKHQIEVVTDQSSEKQQNSDAMIEDLLKAFGSCVEELRLDAALMRNERERRQHRVTAATTANQEEADANKSGHQSDQRKEGGERGGCDLSIDWKIQDDCIDERKETVNEQQKKQTSSNANRDHVSTNEIAATQQRLLAQKERMTRRELIGELEGAIRGRAVDMRKRERVALQRRYRVSSHSDEEEETHNNEEKDDMKNEKEQKKEEKFKDAIVSDSKPIQISAEAAENFATLFRNINVEMKLSESLATPQIIKQSRQIGLPLPTRRTGEEETFAESDDEN